MPEHVLEIAVTPSLHQDRPVVTVQMDGALGVLSPQGARSLAGDLMVAAETAVISVALRDADAGPAVWDSVAAARKAWS